MNTYNNHHIETLGELREYKGKLIVCFYYMGEKQDKPYFKWMGKFMDIKPQPYDSDNNLVQGKTLKMENMVTIGDCYGFIKKAPYEIRGTSCNAQACVRLPTKKEINTYMNFFRHKRIFGY